MLFNAPEFLLVFLPAVLAGYVVLAAAGRSRATRAWLVAASLGFYGWWNPFYVPLLLASMVFNYAVGGRLARTRSGALLAFGIAANVALLGYFKYTGFLVETADRLFGLGLAAPTIVLPLAISFFTFQQIAYLSDARDGAPVERDFLSYGLFITWFPHLVAGPITHHREMLPQFNDPAIFRPRLDNLAVGASLFLLGFFKKAVVADPMGDYARPVFALAAGGATPDLLDAWCGALGYALQIYFDFSGYTDMAIGLSLMFGISLPPNFDSPFKARSIIEFWSRWHMTLTRFLTAYVYNPLLLAATRARMRAGRPLPRRGRMSPGAFASLVAGPTILTMLLSGIWHGAGWQFVVFGLLHGAYLVVNHAWRAFKLARGWPAESPRRSVRAASVLLTFVCVVVALVFFRASDVPAATRLLGGMTGAGGLVLHATYLQLPGIAALAGAFDLPVSDAAPFGLGRLLWVAALLAAVWTLPNTLQLLRGHRTALAVPARPARLQLWLPWLTWRPTPAYGLVLGGLTFVTLARAFSGAPTEFLYFQF